MKKTLFILLLSWLAGTLVSAQQTPTPPKPTAPAARTLTPAEQRQKEKIDREVQRDRQIRAEWAQKQREYEAKQAEKERQRQAKKAEKDREQQEREAPRAQTTAAPTTTSPVSPPSVVPPPTVPEPTRREKKEARRKQTTPEPTPSATAVEPARTTTAPAETPNETARPQRQTQTNLPVVLPADSIATSFVAGEPTVIRPRREFLPKGHLFEPILLDPLEAQTYGSVLPAYYTEGRKYRGSIVPFAFGFAKPFYRRTTEPGHSEEWVLDLASFTQFEAYHDNQLGKARRQIINNDYKISILYNVRRGFNTYRFRIYHLSSHLADDYIYRNRITAPSPNSVNYEIIDVTYSRMAGDWRLYGGLGVVLRNSEERKRLSAQLGTFYKKPSAKATRLVGGVDVKFWQQTDFRPGIHGGIGLEIGRTQNNLTFLVEGYSGFRPYSQYESQQTSWMGVGLYLNPF